MWELPQHSHAGSCHVTELRSNSGADRQKKIDSRAEANDSHPVTLSHAIAELAVGDNAARNEARDLPHQNMMDCAHSRRSIRVGRNCFDADRHLLVLEARLLRGSVEELAFVVVDVGHDTVDRITVDVNVEHVHENGESDRSARDECGLIDLGDHDELAISRSDNEGWPALSDSLRVAEEVRDPKGKQEQEKRREPQSPRAAGPGGSGS